MGRLEDPRHEAMAWAMARGAPFWEAAREAGYGSLRGGLSRYVGREEFQERLAEITHLLWGRSRDLAPVIETLAKHAEAAAKLGSGAGMVAAKQMLTEIARLKLLLPVGADAGGGAPLEPMLTVEEWIATCPPSPQM